MEMMTIGEKTEEDWLWLCSVPELDWKEKMTLLHYFGSPGGIRRADRSDFEDWEKLWISWVRKLYPCMDGDFLGKIRQDMEKKGVRFASREHPDCPKRLRTIADCPYGIFYRGHLPATAPLSVGIVGARACSPYGRTMAESIARLLAEAGAVVISGMAMGIDGIAQRAAVDSGGATYALLGCGAEQCYPRSNIELYVRLQEKGGILSEYPCGTPAIKHHFPARNRLIAGLSDVVTVIEARSHSGSLITARQALDQGRDVYALPGRVEDTLSAGCNTLISDGAGIILSPEEFVREIVENHANAIPRPASGGVSHAGNTSLAQRSEMREQTLNARAEESRERRKNRQESVKSGSQMGLAPDDDLVYSVLDLSPVSRERLSLKTGLSLGKVQECLLRLQLKDLAAEVAKNQFIRQR